MNYCVGDELFLSDKQGSVILRVVPHVSNRTNADRIRAMSDEELAEVLAVFQCEGWNKCCETFGIGGHGINGCGDNPDILAWLQKPAPEVADEADT